MENENVIKDYGSVTLPKDWNEVTLKQYAEICAFYQSDERKFDIRDVLHIFTGLPEDDINDMPVEFVEKMLEHLQFMQNEPKIGEPTNTLEIKGTKYTVNIQNKLKLGEYTAYSNIVNGNKFNFPAILAVLCRKPGEEYTLKFENEELEKRIEVFENVPMLDAMPLINFFINAYIASTIPTLLSSQIKEEINHIASSIETSRANGDLSALSYRRLKRNLGKLEKSMECI